MVPAMAKLASRSRASAPAPAALRAIPDAEEHRSLHREVGRLEAQQHPRRGEHRSVTRVGANVESTAGAVDGLDLEDPAP